MYPDVMPPAQQSLLRKLGPLATRRNFYLGGGTAVACHIGHRRSVDFDWFTKDDLVDPLELIGAMKDEGISVEAESVDEGTLHGTADGVRVSFLEYRYPLLRPPVTWSKFGCQLASLEDLVCMKLAAIAGRGARKDFVDLYALGTEGIRLDRMLELYQDKYATTDVGHVIFSLTFFEDAEAEALPELLHDFGWKDVRAAVEGWVRDYARDA